MCGICGIAHKEESQFEQPLRPVLEKMNVALRHRGPDGEGYYENGTVGLAMRRLAVIDLVTGDQPIANEDRSVWVVMNGEIYNFLVLREALLKRGHKLNTRTDTECLVHLYEEMGDDYLPLVAALRGMFAFALWDEPRRRLLLGRDRLGKKPLYYAQRGGSLYFSSELPSLLEGIKHSEGALNLEIDLQAIDDYLSLQYVPEPLTPFKGIYKLPATHLLIWQDGQIKLERYWQLEYTPKWAISEEEAVEELRRRLKEAVQMRLISDVPLGAHLSGGIDSSIIVALMAEVSSQPVKTFTIGFEEASFSEVAYARAVAERYATQHHEFIVTFGDVPATLEKIVRYMGEPLGDTSALALYHLSRLTRQHVTVALNGDGGDDIFAGYQRYWLDPWAERYLRLPKWITKRGLPALIRYLPDRADKPIGSSLLNGLKRLEQLTQIDRGASILRWGSYFSPEQKMRLWKEEILDKLQPTNAESYLVDRFDSAPAISFLDRTLYTDITTYMPGDLLVKADRMTMASSLEGRSPLLDYELVAWVARLPEKFKVRGLTGKYLLRRAFAEHLPAVVQRRGKQGFGVPVGAWLRGPLSGWARQILLERGGLLGDWFNDAEVERLLIEHCQGRVDHGKRLWALIVLRLWVNVWDLR